jgi:hypothetical protein
VGRKQRQCLSKKNRVDDKKKKKEKERLVFVPTPHLYDYKFHRMNRGWNWVGMKEFGQAKWACGVV